MKKCIGSSEVESSGLNMGIGIRDSSTYPLWLEASVTELYVLNVKGEYGLKMKRLIQDNVIIAHELFHYLVIKNGGSI